MLVESCHLEMTNDQRLSKHLLGVPKRQEVQACNAEVLISLFLSRDSQNEIKQTIKASQSNNNPIPKRKPWQVQTRIDQRVSRKSNTGAMPTTPVTQCSTRKLGFEGQPSSAPRVGAQEFFAAPKAQAMNTFKCC